VTTSIIWPPNQHISSWPAATWPEYLDRLENPISDQEQVFSLKIAPQPMVYISNKFLVNGRFSNIEQWIN
jgi:hypothetical protein